MMNCAHRMIMIITLISIYAYGMEHGQNAGRTLQQYSHGQLSPTRGRESCEHKEPLIVVDQAEDMLTTTDGKPITDNTPLHRAIMEGNPKKALRLVAQEAPLTPLNSLGWTPLMLAAHYDLQGVAQAILKKMRG